MQPYQILLPLVVLLLVGAGVRWQFSRTAEQVNTGGQQSWGIPVTTPFVPTLCKGKPDCLDLTLDEPVHLAP